MPSGGEGYQELFRHDTGNRPREPPAGDDILKRYRNTGHEADQNSMRDGPFVAGPQTQSQGQKRICDEKDRTAGKLCIFFLQFSLVPHCFAFRD